MAPSTNNGLTNGETWYFAYGSNLSIDPRDHRSRLIRRARPVFATGFRLAFIKAGHPRRIYANIVLEPAGIVWGVAYLCDGKAMATLDRAKRVIGENYRPVYLSVETTEGQTIEAKTYVAGKKLITKQWRPTSRYLNLIVNGAKEYELPADYIERIKAVAEEGRS